MRHVAILGAGFCGTMVAVNLLRSGFPGRVSLVEKSGRFGPGLAYSTPHSCHLLNVPAHNMSALEDDPDHFRRWAGNLNAVSFAPRALYGQYLDELLQETSARHPDRVELVSARAVALAPGLRVELDDGRCLAADQVVLATGNLLQRQEGRDPWAEGPLPRGDALVLGTGLTMVDLCLVLEQRGFRGRILALSRHGRMPAAHALGLSPLPTPELSATSLRELFRELRVACREADARQPGAWRVVLDGLRARTPELWQALSEDDRARFQRHVAGLWDTRRHRMAPEVSRTLARLVREGRLEVLAGRLLEVGEGWASYRPRGASEPRRLEVGTVYNCTGLDMNLLRSQDRLLQQLLGDGLVRPDALGLGLQTDAAGRVLGAAWPDLYALGNLRKGQLWESTAVPELRSQAAAVARSLAQSAKVSVPALT